MHDKSIANSIPNPKLNPNPSVNPELIRPNQPLVSVSPFVLYIDVCVSTMVLKYVTSSLLALFRVVVVVAFFMLPFLQLLQKCVGCKKHVTRSFFC